MVDNNNTIISNNNNMTNNKDNVMNIKLFGKWVNISEWWLSYHPGGSKVLRAFNNKDATDVIMAMHSEEAIERIIKYRNNNNNNEVGIDEGLLTNEQLIYYRLQSKARRNGWFKANFGYEVIKAIISFGLVIIGFALLLSISQNMNNELESGNYGNYNGKIWCILLIGFGWFQLGWLGHDWSHHTSLLISNTKWCNINDYLAWLTALFRGNTLLWWKLRHNTHHVLTNQYNHDPDILTQPPLHFYEDFNVGNINKYQACYYIPMLTLLHIYWLYESIMVCIRQSKSINKYTRKHARRDSIAIILHIIFIIYIIYTTGYWLIILLSYMLSGFLTAIVVFASHYNEPRIDSNSSLSLIRQTLKTTINIGSFTNTKFENKLWFYITGGLNMQIEHHLFPTMPRHNLPYTTPLVKEIANELNLEYKETNILNCTTAAISTLHYNVIRNIKRLSSNKNKSK